MCLLQLLVQLLFHRIICVVGQDMVTYDDPWIGEDRGHQIHAVLLFVNKDTSRQSGIGTAVMKTSIMNLRDTYFIH